MNEMMQAIAQAEEQAAHMKEEAFLRANEIAIQAETDAVALIKSAEVKAKNLRESGLLAAQKKANADYAEAIEKSKAEAVAYADERLKKTEEIVKEIVRRVCSGS